MSAFHLIRAMVLSVAALAAFAPFAASAQDQLFPAPGSLEDTDGAQFEDAFYKSGSDADAARFLNMATFGANAADIAAVRTQTPGGWLDVQLNSGTVTQMRPWLEAYAASLPNGSGVSQDQRVQRWYNNAVTSPDQVRQRVAWALGQIVITSDRDDFLSNEPIMMAEWNDIIARNALGNYRNLLREATYSPMMGRYLTTMRNRKFELVRTGTPPNFIFSAGNSGVQPDENYAREVMQLFSIGLLVRGGDFYTTFVDPGNPLNQLNTYAEDDISTLARVFTGLAHDCTQGNSTVGGVAIARNCGINDTTACTGIACRFSAAGRLFGNDPPRDIVANSRGLVHPDWYKPMVCYPRYNDNGRDTSGNVLEDPASTTFTLPPGSPAPNKDLLLASAQGDRTLTIAPSFDSGVPLNCHLTGNPPTLTAAQQQACINYCEGNVNSAVDLLFDHPNTPPMVARQLILRLVTSNPTSEYVTRVAAKFIDNGAGVRGDLKAVVRAVLLDQDARRPFAAANQPVNFGKVREPMLKQVALWRHFAAVSGDIANIPTTNPQGGAANPLGGQPSQRRWSTNNNPQDSYQQRPHGAPSVFNFYEPDYKQPGEVTTAGLFSPEFQIIHEVTAVSAANDLYSRVCSGYGGGSNNCSTGTSLGAPGAAGTPNDRAYFPSVQVDLIPARVQVNANTTPVTAAEDAALIEYYNTRLMGGAMSGTIPANPGCPSNTGTGMKGLLTNALRCSSGINEALNGGTNGTTGGTQVERQRRKALYLLHLIAISPEYSTQR
jgi:uncharacterized protein (DUF1800 family)